MRATQLAQLNLQSNKLKNAAVWCGDGFSAARADFFDAILIQPTNSRRQHRHPKAFRRHASHPQKQRQAVDCFTNGARRKKLGQEVRTSIRQLRNRCYRERLSSTRLLEITINSMSRFFRRALLGVSVVALSSCDNTANTTLDVVPDAPRVAGVWEVVALKTRSSPNRAPSPHRAMQRLRVALFTLPTSQAAF